MTLARIRELTRQGCHVDALAAIAALESPVAESREAVYLTAVNLRSQNQNIAALDALRRLQRQHPGFSRLYEERGHCLTALSEVPDAIAAFEHAVSLNAALSESWRMLEQLHRLSGSSSKAAAALAQLAMLSRVPAPIVEAGSLFSDGELASAQRILHAYLRQSGPQVEALRLLGRIVHQRGALDDAEELLREAVALAPAYHAARADYARVLMDQQQYLQAQVEISSLLAIDPGNADYRSLNATAYSGLGEHERAATLYREVLDTVRNWPHLHLLLGHSLQAVGCREEAIESYRAAAAARPHFGDAYWSLANLKTYRFTPQEIERMREEECSAAVQSVDRCCLCFSLGKAYEDRGEYADSWRYYERGNALMRAQSGYDPQVTEINTQRQMEVYTADFIAAHAGRGLTDPAPIFIVGLPRAGSTLIEQILASHSQVEGTGELPNIDRIARESALTADFRKLAQKYINDTRGYRHGKPFFIDKMPNNFCHIGLIHLMLPKATIIDVRREPMACCFSNWKQLFARGQEFAYRIEDLARYYRNYLELMRHWDAVLPGRVLHVSYEDVVEDTEANVRRILDFCELRFEPGCMSFYNTARSISTASSEQVRQPIFRSGLSQWRNYRPWLGALEEALGDAANATSNTGWRSGWIDGGPGNPNIVS